MTDTFHGLAETGIDVDVLTTMWGTFQAAFAVSGPEVGTPGWLALVRDDPRREAASDRAAFSWWAAGHGLALPVPPEHLEHLVEQRVGDELRAASHAVAGALDWRKVASRLQRDWHGRQRREQWMGAA